MYQSNYGIINHQEIESRIHVTKEKNTSCRTVTILITIDCDDNCRYYSIFGLTLTYNNSYQIKKSIAISNSFIFYTCCSTAHVMSIIGLVVTHAFVAMSIASLGVGPNGSMWSKFEFHPPQKPQLCMFSGHD